MTPRSRLLFTLCVAASAPLAAQKAIPVRTLTPPVATDSGVLSAIVSLRHLPGGRVLIDDASRRRLIVLDSALKTFTITADTASGAANRYGTQPGRLIPYIADSTLFVDRESQAFIVIDPSGKIVNTMAPPKASDLTYLTSTFYGMPGFDPKGRLIYRTRRGSAVPSSRTTLQPDGSGKVSVNADPDSAPILRSDFDARTVDTIAMIKIPVSKQVSISRSAGSMSYTSAINPLPSTDDWALLPDGTIAIIRVQDYHIDWIHPDGTRTSSPKMPFDWRRITQEEKEHLLDSVKKEREAARASAPPPTSPIPGGPVFLPAPIVTVEPSDLPDFYPPLRQAQARVDAEGNIWILPATSVLSTAAQGGLVYDLVNRNGEIFERVRLPEKRALAGFGPNGIVYMSYVPTRGVAYLERATIIRQ